MLLVYFSLNDVMALCDFLDVLQNAKQAYYRYSAIVMPIALKLCEFLAC